MDRLFMWRERALYVGASFDFSMHKHHAVQICVGINGEFDIDFGGNDCHSVRAALISPDVAHQINATNNEIAFVYLEPESTGCGAMLNDKRVGNSYKLWETVDPKLASEFIDPIRDEKTASSFLTQILEMAGLTPTSSVRLDDRIARVLKRIDNTIGSQCTSEELESVACLSSSRLQHLFKEQVGIPIRRYSLWRRIRFVLEQLINGVKLTDAAVDAGFSDTAHFSRTFKQMFGIQPSAFMFSRGLVDIKLYERFKSEEKDSRFLQ